MIHPIFIQFLLMLLIIFALFYLASKWINNSFEYKREQNQILIKAFDKALDGRKNSLGRLFCWC
jgi:hypothetical protein